MIGIKVMSNQRGLMEFGIMMDAVGFVSVGALIVFLITLGLITAFRCI